MRCNATEAQSLRSVERYPLAGGQWTETAPLPTACEYTYGTSLNAHLFVYCTRYNDPSSAYGLVKFHSPSSTWTECASPSIVRGPNFGNLVAAAVRLYLIGGYYSSVMGISDTLRGDVYDPDSDSWSLLTPSFPFYRQGLTNGAHATGVVLVQSSLYIIAGYECPTTCPPSHHAAHT